MSFYYSEAVIEFQTFLLNTLFFIIVIQNICIWVISPGNVQLPIYVVVSIILALASLMSNIFLIQTPITIFDRFLA